MRFAAKLMIVALLVAGAPASGQHPRDMGADRADAWEATEAALYPNEQPPINRNSVRFNQIIFGGGVFAFVAFCVWASMNNKSNQGKD